MCYLDQSINILAYIENYLQQMHLEIYCMQFGNISVNNSVYSLNTMWKRDSLLIISNFFFYKNYFKNASECICRLEQVFILKLYTNLPIYDFNFLFNFDFSYATNKGWFYQLVLLNESSTNECLPCPTYRSILTQQTTFENIVTKGEIAQNEQFLLLSQCFHLYSVNIHTIIEIFHVFE